MDCYKELYVKLIENLVEFWGDYVSEFFWKVVLSKDNFMYFNFDI